MRKEGERIRKGVMIMERGDNEIWG